MERILFGKLPVWLFLLGVILALVAAVGFGALVRERAQGRSHGPMSDVAWSVASVPWTVKSLIEDSGDPMRAMFRGEVRFRDRRGWEGDPAAAGLSGYLVLSRFDPDRRRGVADLVDLSTLETVHTYEVPFEALIEEFGNPRLYENNPFSVETFRMIHPLVFANGDILVKDMWAPMGRFDACGGLKWSLGPMYHHAAELDADGNIWTLSVLPDPPDRLPPPYSNDAVVLVSPEGEILFEKSITDILVENGLGALVFAMFPGYDHDALHPNDVQPVLEDGPHWKKGDIFVDLRHRSTVFLYRPSTNEVLWTKTGPWGFQHDVDILDDHRIRVFDNNVVRLHTGPEVDGHSRILIYDFDTDTVTAFHDDAMAEAEVRTVSEGLVDDLPDGHFLVEEADYGRLLVFDSEGDVVLQYVNGGEDGVPYHLGWVRYLSKEIGDAAIEGIRAQNCSPT